MKKSTAELQEIGDKIVRLVTARTNNLLKAADETLREEILLSEQDLDRLLQELENDLADNGIQAVFYPI